MKPPAVVCVHSKNGRGLCFACKEVLQGDMEDALYRERQACARIARKWARDHRDGRKMPSVHAAAWAELSGNWIAERILLREHE